MRRILDSLVLPAARFVDQNDQTVAETTEKLSILIRIGEDQLAIVC